MEKEKCFFAGRNYMVNAILYFPVSIMLIIFIIIQIREEQMYSVYWLIGGLALLSFVELPFFIVPSTAVIRFSADCVIYKKNIFKRSIALNYFDISKLYIDFCNEPPLKGLRRGKWLSAQRGYICTKHGGVFCYFDLFPSLLAESLKRVDENRIKINISEYAHIGKRYRAVLEEYLTQKQKNILNDLENKKNRRR